MGLPGGYTKYSCFLCLWNIRADGEHYEKIHWPTREELIPGMYYVIRELLISREKTLLPPLHIKLGLVKRFVNSKLVKQLWILKEKFFKKFIQCFTGYQRPK